MALVIVIAVLALALVYLLRVHRHRGGSRARLRARRTRGHWTAGRRSLSPPLGWLNVPIIWWAVCASSGKTLLRNGTTFVRPKLLRRRLVAAVQLCHGRQAE